MSSGLHVRATRSQSRYLLTLEGELDLLTVNVLHDYLEALARADVTTLIVDLRGLTFVDSTGLSEMIGILRRAEELDKKLEMIPGAPSIQRVFVIAGVIDAFEWIDPPEADC